MAKLVLRYLTLYFEADNLMKYISKVYISLIYTRVWWRI